MNDNTIQKISYGLYVLTAAENGKDNGCIVNTVMQVSSYPQSFGVCVSKENLTHDMMMNSDCFNISIISEDANFELFRHFGFQSGKTVDKLKGYTECERASNGIMYITAGTNAYICIKKETTVDFGSHTMFIGKITEMRTLSDIPSATYEYYHNNIKPKPDKKEKSNKVIWRCSICGYEYVGDELPENFICPLCKHPASDFVKVVE